MKKVLFPVLLLITFFNIYGQDPKGQTVIGFIAPTDSLDDYYTHDDYFGKVGFRIVKSILQRDLLPLSRRQEGMKVYVLDDNKTYRLLDCIGNNCWVQDRIDTMWNGTVSTGKITVQPLVDGSTFLYDAYTADGFQRFGVTKSGMLLSGRRMPLAVNVDGLVFLGDRNEMLATDGMAIGKDLIVNGDTAAAFGYNLESNKYNSLLIGRGANRTNRVKSRWMRSVNIGAFQTIPQIELTQDTIRLNSDVLWWNGAPISGGQGTSEFPYTKTFDADSALHWINVNSGFIINSDDIDISSNGVSIDINDPSGEFQVNAPTSISLEVGLSGIGVQDGNISLSNDSTVIEMSNQRILLGFLDSSSQDDSIVISKDAVIRQYVGGILKTEIKNGFIHQNWGSDVASASTITPTGPIFRTTGTTPIQTINIPYSGFTGELKIVAFGSGQKFIEGGNISMPGAEILLSAYRVYTLVYNGSTWYISN